MASSQFLTLQMRKFRIFALHTANCEAAVDSGQLFQLVLGSLSQAANVVYSACNQCLQEAQSRAAEEQQKLQQQTSATAEKGAKARALLEN